MRESLTENQSHSELENRSWETKLRSQSAKTEIKKPKKNGSQKPKSKYKIETLYSKYEGQKAELENYNQNQSQESNL